VKDIGAALKGVVLDRAARAKTNENISEGARAGANYLEAQLKEQKGEMISLTREMVVGLRSILRSAASAGG
jgi:hypothetical protein